MAAISFAVVACLAQWVVVPKPVVACSCMPPPSLAEIAATEDVAILTGTVGPALPDRTPVAVDAWFHGSNPAGVVWLNTGSEMATSCDIFMSAGEHRFFVLYPAELGLYSAISCAPNGLIGQQDGDALVEEAMATFGGGRPPPSPAPEPPSALEPSPWVGPGLIWVALAVGGAGVLFGAIILAGMRTRRR